MISCICTKFSSSLSKFSRLIQLMSPNDCEFQHKLRKLQSVTLKKTDEQWCSSYSYVLYWSHTATLGMRSPHTVKKAERFTTLIVSISSSLSSQQNSADCSFSSTDPPFSELLRNFF